MNYKVAWVTNNLKKYPEYKEDTERFPGLIDYIEDEIEGFVVNEDDPSDFYLVTEFFMMKNVKNFLVTA